jgi:hypothetical protein
LCPILSLASRSVKLDGGQLSADAVRVVHLIADRFKDITYGCPTSDEERVCIYCRLDEYDIRVCRQLNGYCIGCELPGHMMHQHDALLSLYECLETFKVIKKFGLHSSRILQAATLNVIESLYRLHLKKRSTRM